MLFLLYVLPSQHASRHGKLQSLEILYISLSGGRIKDAFMDTFWILFISWIWKFAQKAVLVPNRCLFWANLPVVSTLHVILCLPLGREWTQKRLCKSSVYLCSCISVGRKMLFLHYVLLLTQSKGHDFISFNIYLHTNVCNKWGKCPWQGGDHGAKTPWLELLRQRS